MPQGDTSDLEMPLVVVVDHGQNYVHEDVQVDHNVDDEEQGKPIALIICRHPVTHHCLISW